MQEKTGTNIIHIEYGLEWPFTIAQYQNGHTWAKAGMDVLEDYVEEGYEKLKEKVEQVTADSLKAINEQIDSQKGGEQQ